ncbi:glucose-6-phosphate dehydrogenase [coenzyme F420] [Roseibium sp. TrichSKD4]|uniref:LLM class flavin-dependent oxidoreductase n=1 Tax=Roseibium sp. TrichSKD4 TaxID=744980 RepID=UPI0001E561E0|nr:LLM class flavin-dependent oxidoreductase [Roseibium sp. TrichSKD4]EFO32944.1 glucose-6-phosphate dehydrogenase [coenzyme F420] [Roseibium sp. TrichSKD4]
MDFSLFVHMDRSSPEQSHEELRLEYMDLCKLADEAGMRAVWTGEHHGMDFTISPNPFLELVNVANHTKNLRLGTGTVIAPFWHPIKLAGEAASADLITGGRIELGIARGAYSYEYERLMPGMDAWEAGQRMREMAPLLPKLWQGDCTHEGKFFSFPAATSAPKPLQADGPPIWIAARDPNSHEFGVHNGFNIQVTPLWQGIEEIEILMQRFNAACQTLDGPRPKIMLLHHTYVAADEADISRAAGELSRFYCNFGAWFQNKRPVSQGRLLPLDEEDYATNVMMAPDNMRRDLTMGMAPEVVDRIKRYEDLGYDEFSYWIDSGMSFERKKASLERFVTDVMPKFR